MLYKSHLKLVQSLNIKKNRYKKNLFIAEGCKIINELIHSKIKIVTIFALKEWLEENNSRLKKDIEIVELDPRELSKISNQTQINQVVCISEIPIQKEIKFNDINNICLVLDNIQDPGNLGTIIRIADWYGICHILCSNNTVDLYNSKVIQSTMGSFTRVNVHYLEIDKILNDSISPIYGAVIDGNNIHKQALSKSGFVIIGNESSGISDKIKELITIPISIPNFGKANSLNAAIATAIICDNFKR